MTAASIFSDFYPRLVHHEEQGLFWVLLGFIGSFAFIRMSTRLMRSPKVPWWPGSVVSESGVHLHHLVFGIVTMMVAGALGFLSFGRSPQTEICAAFFGIGAGLTIDEFALWVHLEDVYWSQEGRSSIDATVIAVSAMGLVLVGFSPFAIEGGSVGAVAGTAFTASLVLGSVLVCFFKGRVAHGTVGFFIPPIGFYGAVRLGKPKSAWARRRYGTRNPKKQERSERRFRPDRRTERLKNRFRDLIGGKTTEEIESDEKRAATTTLEARDEVRDAAERVAGAAESGAEKR